MDNFIFDILSDGDLEPVILIAFSHHPKATHYRVSQDKGLILYWTNPNHSNVTALPYPLDADNAVEFIRQWLQFGEVDPKGKIDMDGDCKNKAFRIYNEAWGHVDGEWQAFVAIEPRYAWYGK